MADPGLCLMPDIRPNGDKYYPYVIFLWKKYYAYITTLKKCCIR